MRRFIVVSNTNDLKLKGAKVIPMNTDDIEILFNDDVLNVINSEQYATLLKSRYMYGVEAKFDNYLTGYRALLKQLMEFDSELVCIYDVSTRRYINNYELKYFANNKLLPSKLFNIEIEADETHCHYQTIGLLSIGLKEFVMDTDAYLTEEDFQMFKAIVTNYLIGKFAQVYINNRQVAFKIVEEGDVLRLSIDNQATIYEFYIRDDKYIDEIRYSLIKANWPIFLKLYKQRPDLGQYVINKAKVNAIELFDVGHVEEFTIVCDQINYNQDNLFYAMKYL